MFSFKKNTFWYLKIFQGALLLLSIWLMPKIALANVVQEDFSTSTTLIFSGYTKYQTLGTGLSGTTTSIDLVYYADTTYYGVRVTPHLEECSSENYGDCVTVSGPVIEPNYESWDGIKSVDWDDYALNHCKYYRISLFANGPFGSMGPLHYYGSENDSYLGGSFSDILVSDLYFVLHGVDLLDRSANTSDNLCVDPVIIVPGFLGSFEVSGTWIMDPILHVYDDLLATLEANGYVRDTTLFTFPYDWRNSNVDTALLLKQKINGVKAICNCFKVDIVAHSMGGLVTRQYV